MIRRLDRHAPGVLAGGAFALCGLALDAYESGDAGEPVGMAEDGEVVTCPACRRVIEHVRAYFPGERYAVAPLPDAVGADRRGRTR